MMTPIPYLVLLTDDVSPSIKGTLQRLTLFSNSKILSLADRVGHDYDNEKTLYEIKQTSWDVVITGRRSIAEASRAGLINAKVIFFQNDTYRDKTLLSCGYEIEAFMKSSAIVYDLT